MNGQLRLVFFKAFGESMKGFDLDSRGNAWVPSAGENLIYHVNPNGDILGRYTGGGIDTPWSVKVDGDDNIWVSNFGPMVKGNIFTNSNVSKLAGANPLTRPPAFGTGDPISPPTGYTLPSAGAQVLLHNGRPLYGPGSDPAFTPMMRITNSVIDQAGNLCVINNWKPNIDIANSGNPGGDGICIFVGLAKPKN